MASLVGAQLPDCELLTTGGELINPQRLAGRAVYIIYPFTGRPGHENPSGWDDIPGAHGSTPQLLGFAKHISRFAARQIQVFGLTGSSHDWVEDFYRRNQLPFSLISDAGKSFSGPLQLNWFQAGSESYLTRRTLVAEQGIISHDIYPVMNPASHAEDLLALLSS